MSGISGASRCLLRSPRLTNGSFGLAQLKFAASLVLNNKVASMPIGTGKIEVRDRRDVAEIERLRTALEACRQYLRDEHGAWWNNYAANRLMKEHIEPALYSNPEQSE